MKKWNLGGIAIVLALAIIGSFFTGCGDAKRDDCKRACQRLYDCELEKVDGVAEDSALNISWLSSCKATCDEADEIRGDVADCINNQDTACVDLNTECGINLDNLK